jgi:lipoprotein-releasing system ATP-binding protein
VEICGLPMQDHSDRQRTYLRRAEIGFIYQFHHLLPEFSALENIVLPQLAHGVAARAAQARARDLLAQVGLELRRDHRPAALSGGEQQRVAFCRALANRPRLLLADEPTGNLDPASATHVFDTLLGMVQDHGLSAVIATHNPDLAARMDRRIRLTAGQLTEV